MDADAAHIISVGGQQRGAFGNGHLQLGPPRTAPWVSSAFIANPLIEQAVAAILGEGAFLSFYNGNCNSPDSGVQVLHRDSSPWGAAGDTDDSRATAINVNFSTRAITAANGGPEIWPGSHRDPAEPDLEAERRAAAPPIQLEAPAGAVAFRDHRCAHSPCPPAQLLAKHPNDLSNYDWVWRRMWHRGVPNTSGLMRQMVSLNFDRRERQSDNRLRVRVLDKDGVVSRHLVEAEPDLDRRLVFSSDCEAAFAVPSRYGVDRNVRFVEGPVDHFSGIFDPGGAKAGPIDLSNLARM